MKLIPSDGLIGEARLREAAATECGQVMNLVRAAVQAKLGESYVSLEAMFPDRVVVCKDGRYYAYAYTLGADNLVTLGDAQEVVEQYLPVRMSEASDSFLEAADPEGKTWDAILIRAGLSHNQTYYTDAVLREAAPLFEGARVLARSDADHIKGDGKDARNIVGWISGSKFTEGTAPDTGRVLGTFNFGAGASALRETITDAWKRGKRDLVGLSIDANGTAGFAMREAKRVRVAKSITKINSVDLIVDPSAGGALVRLVEAATDQETDAMKERMLATIQAKAPKIFASIDPATISDADLEARYAEALATPEKTPATAATGVTAEQMAETVRMVEARGYLRTAVATSKLPQAAQDKLLADWSKRERFTEADVDAAIKGERAYVARFTESGKVKLDSDGNIEVEDRSVKIADMLDAFFDPKHKNHRSVQSFRECYVEMTGDRQVTGRIADMDRARLAESMGDRFAESLNSASFGFVLGDAITRRAIADYRTPNQYDVWRPLATIVPVADFRTQHRTRFGGYGDLPIVLEGDPYTALASPTDEEATYAAAKRGGTEDITEEMILADDVGTIRQIPIKLARSAKRTLGKFVLDFIRTNPNIYDGTAFFTVGHGNLGTAALDATSIAARRLAVLKQTEAGSSDRLGIPAKNLLVPSDLESAGVNLFNRDTNLDKTFIQTLQLTVIPVWYWTDATDWALTVDKDDMPWLEIAFLHGNEEPQFFVQDNPTVGSVFSNDKITYKIKHPYGGNVTNFRGADKSVVAG